MSLLRFRRGGGGRKLPDPTRLIVDTTPSFFDRALGRLGLGHLKWIVVLLLVLSVPLIVTPVTVEQQWYVAIFLVIIGQMVLRAEEKEQSAQTSEYLHLFLAWLSIVTTLRYLYYRTMYTLNLDGWLNAFACFLLFAAELYAILTLVLAYFQTLKIQERQPPDMSKIPHDQWYKVDIYIPTYNEDVELIRKTALAAMAIEYADDKKQVYVLDDGRAERYQKTDPRYEQARGRQEQLRLMCEELGCIHMTRGDNSHAKAGNINTAFRKTDGDLVLILDCDHIPSKQILMETVGFFYDLKVAFVQTPHWFYNPDPFERNLLTRGRIPVGNELFYKVLQKGNDYWNAAFFCGSAAVIRKKYALEVGGIAVETVTEDCHTALRLHSLGYKSIYYDKVMVAGLAPETFASYMGQQVRWARGMAQILRIENPMFNRKLNLNISQRICYLSATSHFFYGYPRLVYAIAPTLFLLFGINPVQGLGMETLAYALPHILLALNTNHIIYKKVRFSFWNEIFEFVMAFQSGWVTLLALINPKMGTFNVTDKGVSISKRIFDWQSMRNLVMVTALVVIALIAVPFWLLLRPEDWQAVVVNALWCIFNLILLVAALLVGFEQPQMRVAHRLDRRLGVTIYSGDTVLQGETVNVSETGALIALDTWPNLPDEIELEIRGDYSAKVLLTARIIRGTPVDNNKMNLAVDFVNLSPKQADDLVLVLYSDVREWYSQERKIVDRPLASFGFLATGFLRALRDFQADGNKKVRKRVSAPAQLYWDGNFFAGTTKEMGVSSLLVELDGSAMSGDKTLQEQDLHTMQSAKPLVGLLLSRDVHDPSPTRFLAQIISVYMDSNNRIVMELNFPDQYKRRQSGKIKQLLAAL